MIYTYFISKGWPGPIKIGRSKNPPTRMKHLQTGCPERLYLIAWIDGDLEQMLHERFEPECLLGEWFEPSEALLDMIEGTDTYQEPEP